MLNLNFLYNLHSLNYFSKFIYCSFFAVVAGFMAFFYVGGSMAFGAAAISSLNMANALVFGGVAFVGMTPLFYASIIVAAAAVFSILVVALAAWDNYYPSKLTASEELQALDKVKEVMQTNTVKPSKPSFGIFDTVLGFISPSKITPNEGLDYLSDDESEDDEPNPLISQEIPTRNAVEITENSVKKTFDTKNNFMKVSKATRNKSLRNEMFISSLAKELGLTKIESHTVEKIRKDGGGHTYKLIMQKLPGHSMLEQINLFSNKIQYNQKNPYYMDLPANKDINTIYPSKESFSDEESKQAITNLINIYKGIDTESYHKAFIVYMLAFDRDNNFGNIMYDAATKSINIIDFEESMPSSNVSETSIIPVLLPSKKKYINIVSTDDVPVVCSYLLAMPNSTLPFSNNTVDFIIDNITLDKIKQFHDVHADRYKYTKEQVNAQLERIAILREFCLKSVSSRDQQDKAVFKFSAQDVILHFYSKQSSPVQKFIAKSGFDLGSFSITKTMTKSIRDNSWSLLTDTYWFVFQFVSNNQALLDTECEGNHGFGRLGLYIAYSQGQTVFSSALKAFPDVSGPLLHGFGDDEALTSKIASDVDVKPGLHAWTPSDNDTGMQGG